MNALHPQQSIDEKGKIRVKEHVEGNWATHVFIPGMKGCQPTT